MSIADLPDTDWRIDALCRIYEPDLWFPGKSEHGVEAHRICKRCNVQAECLADALSLPVTVDDGIRAGTTPPQRRKMRRAA